MLHQSQKPLRSAIRAFALAASFPLVLTGCQDEEFGYQADQIKYAKNFTQMYGEIPSDKSWDLSSSADAYNPSTTRAGGSLGNGTGNQNLTEGTHYDLKDYWEVPSQTLKWLEDNLIEQKDNRWLGSNFVLKINPNSDFAIIPIYQGKSAINSSLSIKINGYNIKEICPRSKNIQVKDADKVISLASGETEWQNIGYYDGAVDTTYQAFLDFKAGTKMYPSYTDEADAVRAKPVYFRTSKLTNLQNEGFMYLDLVSDNKYWEAEGRKWDSKNEWTKIGDHLTSINPKGQMVAFNLSWDGRPHNNELPDIHEGTGSDHKLPSQVLIIGCEDAHGEGSDYDVNDVVYMIIGYPYAPEIVPTTQIIKKRYMCEDLGATDDFDFNDIVIDVNQSMEYQLITNPEGKAEDYEYDGNLQVYMQAKPETKKQWARISHVCGTLPFQVKVGDFYFPKVTDPTDDYKTRTELAQPAKQTRTIINIAETDGWNPNETKEISGWDPKTNNVKICVEWKGGRKADNQEHVSIDYDADSKDDHFADFANGECKIVTFPHNGDVPYIIAVDQDIPWMKERVSIPESWVTGNLVSREGAAGPGSSAQYLDYGNDADGHTNEAVIWTGDVYGKQYSTGLDLGSNETSATYNGLKEAIGKSFNILAVYTTTPGAFGLAYDNSGWAPLTINDADQYVVSSDKVGDLYCTKIMLTGDQLTQIRNNGLIIQNCAEGMHIQQVSMMRNNPDRKGFNVRFNTVADLAGRVTTADYRRYGDDARGTIPFGDACFENGSSVEFTAEAKEGYKFSSWTITGTDVTTNSSTDNPITVSDAIIKNWGISNNIVRLTANFTAKPFYSVGGHIQVKNASGNYVDNNAVGKLQLSTSSTFFTKDGDNYVAMSAKTIEVSNGELVYVHEGTQVTFTIPNNPDYKLDEANNFSNYERTSIVDHDAFTPYVKYSEKADPLLALTDPSQATIVLDYNTPSVNIRWTKADGAGDVNFKGYSWPSELNTWRNGSENSHTMRAQDKNFDNKKIIMYVEANDTYKSAEVEIDVTVKDYVNSVYNGFRVPITDNKIPAGKISDALRINSSNAQNIKVQIHRGGYGLPADASIYSSTHQSDWTKTIRSNEQWTAYARGNDSYDAVSYGMQPRSICFIISASDFKNYLSNWNSNIVIDSGTYTGWDEVYVSLTDDQPFQ